MAKIAKCTKLAVVKDPDIVPEEAPIIIFDSKSAAFMDNNSKIPSTQGTFLEY